MTPDSTLPLAVRNRTPTTRWWRRRPPAGLSGFARGVWWTGHAQLFVSAALWVIGPASFALAWLPYNALTGTFGMTAWFGTAMALPFATSGMMLRAYAVRWASREGPLFERSIELAVTVVLIALISIAFVWLLALAIALAAVALTSRPA
ncbi:hypothetical protein [Leifsonia sp. NPDC080035]|uniref:Uncharacterized protein n=1 Tax=Leifsonia sp. NPDC080035 TaxID=3143936 RepID=A0AAU7GAI9_9MICO